MRLLFKIIKNVLFLIFGLSYLSIQCQEVEALKSKANIEAEIACNLSLSSGYFNMPSIAYSFGKHNVSLGYLFRPEKQSSSSVVKNGPGFSLSYNFFPYSRSNRFNLHFCFRNQVYYFEKNEQQSHFSSQLVRNVFFENSIGYGFHFTHFKRSYIRFDTGLGIFNAIKRTDYWKTYEIRPNINFQIAYGIRFIK